MRSRSQIRLKRSRRPERGRLLGALAAGAIVESGATWLRSGRLGGDLVVRCRQGHLFSTIWIPAASVKSLRLGWWRFQYCPVGRHWSLVTPVNEAGLSAEELVLARERKDVRIP